MKTRHTEVFESGQHTLIFCITVLTFQLELRHRQPCTGNRLENNFWNRLSS